MKKSIKPLLAPLAMLCFAPLVLQNCKPAQQTAATAPEPSATSTASVSYELTLRPIMQKSCTPCHFPAQGQKKMLDTYEATRANIYAILLRVQLPTSDEKYMPYKQKRPSLTNSEVQAFRDWLNKGMPK